MIVKRKRNLAFGLEMKDGYLVRDIEGLREHFSLTKVMEYQQNGKLDKWLKNEGLSETAEAFSKLPLTTKDYAKRVCMILDVPYTEELQKEQGTKLEVLKNEAKAKEVGVDEAYMAYANQIAYTQEDLTRLVAAGKKTIYLYEGQFQIPLEEKGIRYIGIQNPIAIIESTQKVDFEKLEIIFEGIAFDVKYEEVMIINDKRVVDVGYEYDDETKKGYLILELKNGQSKKVECTSCGKYMCVSHICGSHFEESGSYIEKKGSNDKYIWFAMGYDQYFIDVETSEVMMIDVRNSSYDIEIEWLNRSTLMDEWIIIDALKNCYSYHIPTGTYSQLIDENMCWHVFGVGNKIVYISRHGEGMEKERENSYRWHYRKYGFKVYLYDMDFKNYRIMGTWVFKEYPNTIAGLKHIIRKDKSISLIHEGREIRLCENWETWIKEGIEDKEDKEYEAKYVGRLKEVKVWDRDILSTEYREGDGNQPSEIILRPGKYKK